MKIALPRNRKENAKGFIIEHFNMITMEKKYCSSWNGILEEQRGFDLPYISRVRRRGEGIGS